MVDTTGMTREQIEQSIQIRPVPGTPNAPDELDNRVGGNGAPAGFEPPMQAGAPKGFLPPGHPDDHGPVPPPVGINALPGPVRDRVALGHGIVQASPQADSSLGDKVSDTIHAMREATDLLPGFKQHFGQAIEGGNESLKDGIANILDNKPATGVGNLVWGAGRLLFSPLEGIGGAVGDKASQFALNATGNQDFADKVGLMTSLITNGGAAAETGIAPLVMNKATGELSRVVVNPQGQLDTKIVGKPPQTGDFDRAAEALAPKSDAVKRAEVKNNLVEYWNAHGVHPNEILETAQKSPVIARDLGAARTAPPVLPSRPGASFLTDLENKFYRLKGEYTADRLEMDQRIADIPSEVRNYETQEEWYKHGEGDDSAQMSKADIDNYNQHMLPFKKEEAEIWTRLQIWKGKNPNLDIDEFDPTYMHRAVRGKTPVIDRLAGVQTTNPMLSEGSGGILDRNPGSLNERTYFTMQNELGERILVKRMNGGKAAQSIDGQVSFKPADEEGSLRPGEKGVSDEAGDHTWTMTNAWTREIEAETSTRYYHNALAATIDNILRMRSAERAMREVENLRASPEWKAYTDPRSKIGHNGGPPLDENAQYVYPTNPLFKNDLVDKRIANVLDDFWGQTQEHTILQTIRAINDFAIQSLFWTPIPHALNTSYMLFVERGWDNFTPQGMASFFANGAKAIHAVRTLGPDYQAALRAGGALMRGGLNNADFYGKMLSDVGGILDKDPSKWQELADATGLGTIDRMRKAWYAGSSKALWAFSDTLAMTRFYELQQKGMSLQAAIEEAERTMPNYRIPSNLGLSAEKILPAGAQNYAENLIGRSTSIALRKSYVTEFGRWKYGLMKMYGNMAKDLAVGTMEQRMDAVGKMVALGTLMVVVGPAITAGWQSISDGLNKAEKALGLKGDKKPSELQANDYGPTRLARPAMEKLVAQDPKAWPKAVRDYYKEDGKTLTGTLSSMIFNSPSVDLFNMLRNNQLPSGRKFVEPSDARKGNYASVGIQAATGLGATLVEPLKAIDEAMKKGISPNDALVENLFGFNDSHSSDVEMKRARAFKFQDREAATRARPGRSPTAMEHYLEQKWMQLEKKAKDMVK